MSTRVYFSYASGDYDVAHALYDELRRSIKVSGVPLEAFGPRTSLKEGVREDLKSASAVVILVSARSLASAWVMFEVGAAAEMDKPIIPVLIRDDGIEDRLPDWLKGLEYLDARGRPIKDIASALERALPKG